MPRSLWPSLCRNCCRHWTRDRSHRLKFKTIQYNLLPVVSSKNRFRRRKNVAKRPMAPSVVKYRTYRMRRFRSPRTHGTSHCATVCGCSHRMLKIFASRGSTRALLPCKRRSVKTIPGEYRLMRVSLNWSDCRNSRSIDFTICGKAAFDAPYGTK